eukprot:Nk52_evm2s183 gene=Nk52_evmTU2s183
MGRGKEQIANGDNEWVGEELPYGTIVIYCSTVSTVFGIGCMGTFCPEKLIVVFHWHYLHSVCIGFEWKGRELLSFTCEGRADVFTKKEWYDVKAPSMFNIRQVGKTCVNRTAGTKIAADGLKGRVFECSLADLNKDEDQAFRKIRLHADEVQGKNVLTNFHGMTFTTDKLRSLVKKWQSLIEAFVDVTTTDGYKLRIFVIGFTKRRANQVSKCTYAQTAQIRQIRKKMFDIVTREASTVDLKDLVAKFVPGVIGKEIEKAVHGIYPLQNVFVRKCKIMRKPKFEIGKLLELHGDSASTEAGSKVKRSGDFKEPEVLESV